MNIESIKENIQKHGWQFQYVFDTSGEKEEFSYTIGFEESFDHPEIMIFGLKRETMHSILSDIASEIKEGREFKEGVRTANVLGGEFEVIFKSVAEQYLPEYAGIATRFYDRPIRLMVMFWPDKSNILPTEAGCTLTVQNEALKIV